MLTALREIIRDRWWRRNAERWSNLIEKIDRGRDHVDFWEHINRMLGRKTRESAMTIKDENERELKSKEEVVLAFRRKLERTFKINEEENDEFNPVTEREVEKWLGGREN